MALPSFRLSGSQPLAETSRWQWLVTAYDERALWLRLTAITIALLVAAGVGTAAALLTRGPTNVYAGWPAGLSAPVLRIPGPLLQPSGHVVTGVEYLPGDQPDLIGQVHFHMRPFNAIGVQAEFVLGGPWYACGAEHGLITCDTTNPPLRRVDVSEFSVRVAR
jgi:hypothetical protein